MGKNTTPAPAADQTADQTADNAADQSPDLQAQLDEATAQRDQAIADYNHAIAERDQAIAERDQARVELDEKAEELNLAEALIEEQTGKLAAAEVAQAEGPVVVTHAKEQYRVLAPKFQHNGLIVEARSLATNPELVRQLVEAESGVLQKVVAAA